MQGNGYYLLVFCKVKHYVMLTKEARPNGFIRAGISNTLIDSKSVYFNTF